MPAAGDFSATAAQTITLRAEEMWSNPMLFAGLDTKAATIRKQLEVQTARVRVLEDPDNDRDAKISWLDPCPVEDQACGDECDVTGTELFSDSKNYSMTMCREAAPKSINFDKLRTNTVTLDEQRALIIAKQAKALDEWWNLQALLKAKLFAGPNMYLPAGWTYAAGTTTIPNDQYNLSLIADLERSMMINHLEGAYITEKGDFWTMIRNAQLSAGNAEGAGDAARARILDGKFVDDFYGFQRAALTEDAFIINPSAMAVATKARFAQVATHETGSNFDRWVWSIASPELPGIRYDVIRTFKCVNSVITEHYAMKTRGDIWQNPLGCPETINGTTYTPTGIISITRGAAA